jgi:para-nitrobenzyl esterase
VFIGQLVSQFGGFFTYVALPVQIYQLTSSSAVVGLLGTAEGKTLNIAALRALSSRQLDERVAKMSAPGAAVRFGPIVDGLFLPNAQSVGKNENDTPILTGMTANEMTGLNPAYGKTTVASFREQVAATYGAAAPDVMALYPAKDDGEAWASLDALARDRGLAALYFWARQRTTRYPIYAYLWTHAEPGPDSERYGAFHSSEIPYVFDTLDTSTRPFEKADRNLAEELSAYWVNYVKTGDPNGKRLATWPKLTADDKQILELGDRTRDRPILPPRELDMFERYVKGGGEVALF